MRPGAAQGPGPLSVLQGFELGRRIVQLVGDPQVVVFAQRLPRGVGNAERGDHAEAEQDVAPRSALGFRLLEN